MFKTSRSGNVQFTSLLQIYSFINIYRIGGEIKIYQNDIMINRFVLTEYKYVGKDVYIPALKTAFWHEVMKNNHITNTYGSVFERSRIVINKYLPNGSVFIKESQNTNLETLRRAYYPNKNVVRYMIEDHDWKI